MGTGLRQIENSEPRVTKGEGTVDASASPVWTAMVEGRDRGIDISRHAPGQRDRQSYYAAHFSIAILSTEELPSNHHTLKCEPERPTSEGYGTGS